MLHRTIAVSLAPVAVLVAAACSSSAPQCRVGADCASGACDSSGRCVAASSSSGGDSGSGGGDDSAVLEAGDDAAEASPGDDGGGGCKPNNDGVVTRAEVPMMAGLHASFVVAENVAVDSAGTKQPDGTRVWDLSGALQGDHTVIVTTDAPTGQWFSAQFTTATYTTKLSDTQTLLGVFQAQGQGLVLQGVVSPTSGAQQTEVSYAPAAQTLSLPMQIGASWGNTAQISGTYYSTTCNCELSVPYSEQYQSKVDARGTLKVPYGTFQVLRVQTTLTRTVGALVTVTQSLAFIAECFGPVASLTSQTTTNPNPPESTEFTNAAEARRLAP
ncbi:MAG TPA: hypothetical protein VIF15_16960 [Polyangiaceae bacterium]|jgi:hypothetical protein